MQKKPIIIITGPTAVGKTSLSVNLAKAIGGEIISADSMQIYQHMDIGSAKITSEEMEGVTHHLIDLLDPKEEFHVAKFQELAKEALEKIYSKNKIPILVGGTGFYIQALLYDINFSKEDSSKEYRNELELFAKTHGEEALHQKLAQIDPKSAEEIHANNVKRVIRAIEYYHQNGRLISEHNMEERQRQSPYEFFYYVLTCERETLYQRIEKRIDLMLEAGLIDEVKKLSEMGCTKDMVSMKGIGYKEILEYLEGSFTLEEAVQILKRDTRHFAKRQLTWFRREREVRWLDLDEFQWNQEALIERIIREYKNERGIL